MEEFNITGVFDITESKKEFKKKVKDICTKENDKSLKQMISQYKKMKAMRDEIVKGNTYFFKESLRNIRTLFRFRVELFDAKGNFKNKKEVKEKGSLLCESCEKKVDENTHILYCSAYKELREGKSINNDTELCEYLQKVLEIRSKLNLNR